MLTLRPYQISCLEAIKTAYYDRKITKQLAVLPTGTGKALLISNLKKYLDVIKFYFRLFEDFVLVLVLVLVGVFATFNATSETILRAITLPSICGNPLKLIE